MSPGEIVPPPEFLFQNLEAQITFVLPQNVVSGVDDVVALHYITKHMTPEISYGSRRYRHS